MGYNPIGAFSDVEELAIEGVDANAETETASLSIGSAKLVTFQVIANTGSHGTHITKLQRSLDNVNWVTIADATLEGVGVKGPTTVAEAYVRLKITTAEGAPSTVDIIIQAK